MLRKICWNIFSLWSVNAEFLSPKRSMVSIILILFIIRMNIFLSLNLFDFVQQSPNQKHKVYRAMFGMRIIYFDPRIETLPLQNLETKMQRVKISFDIRPQVFRQIGILLFSKFFEHNSKLLEKNFFELKYFDPCIKILTVGNTRKRLLGFTHLFFITHLSRKLPVGFRSSNTQSNGC